MYKLLFTLLLIPAMLQGQTDMKQLAKGPIYSGTGTPVKTGYNDKSLYLNLTDRSVWVYTSSTAKWAKSTDQNQINFVTGAGPKGDKGDTGATGAVGQNGKDGVCPSCPPNNNVTFTFGATYVFTNGIDDAPAIQRAVDTAYVTGKRIYLVGNLHFRSTGVKIPKDIQHLNIEGYATLWADIDVPFTYFYSDMPVDVTQAESVYTNRKISIKYLAFEGYNSGANQKQTGLDLHALEGGEFSHLWGKHLKTFIDASFQLRTSFTTLEANQCIYGLVVRPGTERYSNVPYKEAASNGVTINNFRGYGAPWTKTHVKVVDASMVEINNLTIEGGYCEIGLDFIASSSSSTGLVLNRIHEEVAARCGIAAVRISSSTMLHHISYVNFVKPSIFVEMVSLGGGWPELTFSYSSNQRTRLEDNDPPIFKTVPKAMWNFDKCDEKLMPANVSRMFTGAVMKNTSSREQLNANESGYTFDNSPK